MIFTVIDLQDATAYTATTQEEAYAFANAIEIAGHEARIIEREVRTC